MKPQVTIVTGASSGLGLELALKLSSKAVRVVGVARSRPTDKRWLEAENAGNATFVQGDVSDQQTVIEAMRLAHEAGTYNCLINCAGQGVFGPCDKFSAQDIQAVLAGNLVGTIMFCTASIEGFSSTGGTIVNVMSTAAQVGRANETIYCASKWGARGYTEALRAELKGKPIRVVAVFPGGMKTEFWQRATGHAVNADKFMDPSEVADQIITAIDQKRTLQVTDLVVNRA